MSTLTPPASSPCLTPHEAAEFLRTKDRTLERVQTIGVDHEARVAAEMARERVRREARRRLDAEERGSVTPPDDIVTLRDWLAQPDSSAQWRIASFQPVDTRIVCAAQMKTGKTTLVGEVVRSLVDGEAWLGRYEVQRIAGCVAVIDLEMARGQLRRWLRELRIRNDHRVIVVPLRGRAGTFNLVEPAIRALWVQWLRERDVAYLVVDPLRPVLDALGLDERTEVGPFLVAFDMLLRDAGIAEPLVVHHMGHVAERSRGDSRLRDWPDVEWRLFRQSDDPASPRYITAYGRDVDVRERRRRTRSPRRCSRARHSCRGSSLPVASTSRRTSERASCATRASASSPDIWSGFQRSPSCLRRNAATLRESLRISAHAQRAICYCNRF